MFCQVHSNSGISLMLRQWHILTSGKGVNRISCDSRLLIFFFLYWFLKSMLKSIFNASNRCPWDMTKLILYDLQSTSYPLYLAMKCLKCYFLNLVHYFFNTLWYFGSQWIILYNQSCLSQLICKMFFITVYSSHYSPQSFVIFSTSLILEHVRMPEEAH